MFVAIMLAGLALTGCASAPEPEPPTPVNVRYEVLSTTNHNLNKMKNWTPAADARFTTPKGTQEVYTHLPLMNQQGGHGVTVQLDAGKLVQLVAQADRYSGDLTCRIYIDDVLVSESKTMASYGVVTCEATT